MIRTNEAFRISLRKDIEYLDHAMRLPFGDPDYGEAQEEILRRAEARLIELLKLEEEADKVA